jgi:hypothetical protein
VARGCNLIYSGGRDQEGDGARQARAKISYETPFQPMTGCGGSCLSPELQGEHE